MTRRPPTDLDDWLKLHVGWYTDGVLRAAAKVEPTCLVMFPILLAMAKAQSHAATNPDGRISTDLDDLAAACCVTIEQAHHALDTLAEGEFVTYTTGRLQTLEIRVTNFRKWNVPRKGKAARQERHDADKRAGVLPSPADATPTHSRRAADAPPTIDKTKTETRQIKDTSPTTVDDHTNRRPKDLTREIARTLFAEWLTATNRNPNQNRLSDKRIGMVRARLRDGYTQSQLSEAIRGIAGSAWHAGQNPNGTRYDTFEFVMRSGENVEKGCEFAAAAANQQATRDAGVDVEGTLRWYRDTLGYTDEQLAVARRQMEEGAA